MRFEKFKHENVRYNGTFHDQLGSVITDGDVRLSQGDGCQVEGCHCSDGIWLSIILPRTADGVVEGVKVHFESQDEMEDILSFRY